MALPHSEGRTGRTRPWRTGALASMAVAGGVAVAGAALLVPGQSAEAAADAAASTLVNLTIDDVPALGLTAFHGTYAASAVPQNGGDGVADLSQDPDGVLRRISVSGASTSKVHSDAAKGSAQAQLATAAGAKGAAVTYSLNGKEIYSVASLDSHAECTTGTTTASASVHTAANAVNLLGTSAPEGMTTTVQVTGAQIGASGVDHGSLSVKNTVTATPAQQAAGNTARAHQDLVFTGTFYDAAGKELYSGEIQKVRLGDATATCEAAAPASPSGTATSPSMPTVPSTTPATPAVVPTTVTVSGSAAPAAPGLSTPMSPSGGAVSTTSSPRHMRHDSRSRAGSKGAPAKPENSSMQPAGQAAPLSSSGSGASPWWIALSAIGLGGGMLLFFFTRRRGKHQ